MTYYKGKGLQRDEPTGTPLSNYQEIIKLQKQVADLKRRCCCNQGLGFTELDPPVDAPGANGPFELTNLTSGKKWYWDGDSWEEFSFGSEGPLVWAGLVTFFAGDDPVPDVMFNSLGGTTVFTNVGGGSYVATNAGKFPAENRVFITPDRNFGYVRANNFAFPAEVIFNGYWGSADTINFSNNGSQGELNEAKVMIKIEVYPT